MFFSLEAVKAKKGDALVLHYGDGPDVLLIDGGYKGVWHDFLRPRLDTIKQELSPDDPLPLAAVGLSHIDEDHIAGLLDMARELRNARDNGDPELVDVEELWHNGLRELLDDELDAASLDVLGGNAVPETDLIVASVPQGNQLDADAETLGWKLNKSFGPGPILSGDEATIGPLTFTAIAPDKDRLKRLREDWKSKSDAATIARAEAAELDKTVYNLSSVVLLVDDGDGHTMLLTGDARHDHMLEGLEENGLLDAEGEMDVDLLKLPHHGSDRNIDTDFFRRVRAKHYVISCDGSHHNPEAATLAMLREARGDDDYEVWLPYRTGKQGLGPKLRAWEDSLHDGVTVHYPPDDRESVIVDLADEVTY